MKNELSKVYRIEYNDYGYEFVSATSFEVALAKFRAWYMKKHKVADYRIKLIEQLGEELI